MSDRWSKTCSECRAGEIDDLAAYLVRVPNDSAPNLKVRKWVCEDHYLMLVMDYGDDLEIMEDRRTECAAQHVLDQMDEPTGA